VAADSQARGPATYTVVPESNAAREADLLAQSKHLRRSRGRRMARERGDAPQRSKRWCSVMKASSRYRAGACFERGASRHPGVSDRIGKSPPRAARRGWPALRAEDEMPCSRTASSGGRRGPRSISWWRSCGSVHTSVVCDAAARVTRRPRASRGGERTVILCSRVGGRDGGDELVDLLDGRLPSPSRMENS